MLLSIKNYFNQNADRIMLSVNFAAYFLLKYDSSW